MEKQLKLKDFVLLGRTFEEYCAMFNLDNYFLSKNIILDVASRGLVLSALKLTKQDFVLLPLIGFMDLT